MKSFLFALLTIVLSFPGYVFAAQQGSGTLEVVSASVTSSLERNSIHARPFFQMKVTAKDDNIWLYGMRLRRSGRSSFSDFDRVWATFDGKSSHAEPILHDDTVRLRFKKPRFLGKGETKVISVYASPYSYNVAGKNVFFSLLALNSSAAKQVHRASLKESFEEIRKKYLSPEKPNVYCYQRICYRAP